MQRILISGAAALLGAAILLLPGGIARAADVTVRIDTCVDAPVGSLAALATVPTGAFAGQTCDVTSVGVDRASVHPRIR